MEPRSPNSVYSIKVPFLVFDIFSGLFSIQEIIRLCNAKKYYVTVKMRRIQDISNAHEDLRSLDKQDEPRNSTQKYILLDLSTEPDYQKIMKQVSIYACTNIHTGLWTNKFYRLIMN